jgi:peptidoglycan/LPS O-acetylase OafA/YrhL
MIPQSRSLYPLTGLRFVAAAMIVLWHIGGQFCLPLVILGGWPLTGVSLFFILSGYSFYVSRIARIWPSHVACFLLMFVLVQNVPENGTS